MCCLQLNDASYYMCNISENEYFCLKRYGRKTLKIRKSKNKSEKMTSKIFFKKEKLAADQHQIQHHNINGVFSKSKK